MSQSLDKPLDRGKLLHRRLICLLLASMRQVPGLGAVVELAMGWQQAAMELRQQQDKQSLEERVSQLEEAMRIPPGEIKSLAVEVIDQQRRQGLAISADRAEAIVEIAGYLPATIRERVQSTLHQARHYGTALQTVLPLDDSASEMEKNEFDRALLPRRRPRFQSGDKVLEGPPQWRLTELIGTGSFGEVWQAYHRQMRRYFAVKFCHDEVSAKILVREAETLITLHERLPDHPQVVKLVELQLEVEPYWLAFEYVQGGTLESLMRAKQFGWQEAVQLVASLCRGMAAVHDIGIVHRDLKPENILLTAEGVPRITDFGIGKIIVEQESKTRLQEGTILAGAGTPVYASKEQLRGLAAEPTDDVYSLGVILWQLLVHSLEAPQYVKVSLQEAPAPIPEAVQQIVLSCIDCPRKHRPANAKVLLQQLETVLGNSPVKVQQSQPQSPPSKSPPVSSPQSVSGLERLPIAQDPEMNELYNSLMYRTIDATNNIKPGRIPKSELKPGERREKIVPRPKPPAKDRVFTGDNPLTPEQVEEFKASLTGSYKFSVPSMLTLLEVFSSQGSLKDEEGMKVVGVETTKRYNEYRNFLFTGSLINYEPPAFVKTADLDAVWTALQNQDAKGLCKALVKVPSFNYFLKGLKLGTAVRPGEIPEISKSAFPTYCALVEISGQGLAVSSEGVYATPVEPSVDDFAKMALEVYKNSSAKKDKAVPAGLWLETLAKTHGVHPLVARRLLNEAQEQGILKYALEENGGSALPKRVLLYHIGRKDNLPILEQANLYSGEFFLANQAAVNLRLVKIW